MPTQKTANTSPSVEFGRRLVAARRAAGYASQTAAAEAAGMNRVQYGDLERGDKDPRWSTVRRIVDGLGLDPTLLFSKELGQSRKKTK